MSLCIDKVLDFKAWLCYLYYVVERLIKEFEMTNGKTIVITNPLGVYVARDGNQVWTRKERGSLVRLLKAKGYVVY